MILTFWDPSTSGAGATASTTRRSRGGRPEGGRLFPEERSDVGRADRQPNPSPTRKPHSRTRRKSLNSAFGDRLWFRCAFGDFLHVAPARRRAYLINDRRARPVPGSDMPSGNSGDHRFVDHVGVVIRSRAFAVKFPLGAVLVGSTVKFRSGGPGCSWPGRAQREISP